MADLRVLNIDPGANAPVIGTDTSAKAIGGQPDCPECGANHYMHETRGLDLLVMICMSCGTQYKAVYVTQGDA